MTRSDEPPHVPVPLYEPPDDYERRIERGLAALERLPRGEDWEVTKRAIDNMPTRAEIAEVNEQAAIAREIFAERARARYTGTDPDGIAELDIDANGRLSALAFGTGVRYASGRELAAALVAAWDAAEESRAEDAERLAGLADRLRRR